MKTVKINKNVRKMIEEYSEKDETVNQTISRLIKSSKPLPVQDRTPTNITISEENLELLKKMKSHPNQAHCDTIRELLLVIKDH